MRTTLGGLLLVLLLAMTSMTSRAQEEAIAQEQMEKSAAQTQLDEVLGEYKTAQTAFREKLKEAKTDEDRTQVYQTLYPNPVSFASRVLAVASEHPKDPAAVDALVWVAQNVRSGVEVEVAMKLLTTDYVESPKLAALASRLGRSQLLPVPALLLAILEKSPHHEARGNACMSLAQNAVSSASMATMLANEKDPARLTQLKTYLGEERAKVLATVEVSELNRQAEALYERVVSEFGDIESRRGTLGDQAERNLYEIRNLAIGKVAPEISGKDVEAIPFKLSDYRGKVVMLDFWGDW